MARRAQNYPVVKLLVLTVLLLSARFTWAEPQDQAEADDGSASAQDAVRQRLVDLALSLQGTPYVYAAESPRGFDCSGFVHYLYSNAAFVDLPRTSRSQAAQGTVVDLAEARPGDVLIYGSPAGVPSHVAVYLGNGSLVHAASRGPHRGIVVASLSERYFESHFLGVRSFLTDGPQGPVAAEAPVVLKCQLSGPDPVTETKPVFLGSPVVVSLKNTTDATGFTVTVERAGAEPPTPVLTQSLSLPASGSSELTLVPPETGLYRLSVLGPDAQVVADRRWRVVQKWGG